jgi:pimeloyl-ACP methyl ester carboxylesterase
MGDRPLDALDRLLDRAGDTELGLHARFWTGRLVFHVGDDHRAVRFDNGRLTAVEAVSAAEPLGATDVAYTITPSTWAALLEPLPQPMAHDWSATRHLGTEVSGDTETLYQYYAAIRRIGDLLRRPDPAPAVLAGGGGYGHGDWEPITGGYLHLDLGGDRYRVYVEQAGNPDGLGLLLQHTAGADGRQWRHVLADPELRERFRLVAYDLPYHGRSLPPTGRPWWAEEYRLTREFLMSVPIALAGALGMERPVYMGSSIGGHLAVDLARYHPDLFRAVVGLEAGHATPGGFRDWWFHPRISNQSKAAFMEGLMSPHAPEAYRKETGWVYSQGAPPTFKGDLFYYCVDHDLTGQAHLIDTSRCEVHLLTGEYDYSATPEMSKALAADIPGATYADLPGLGHFPMSEDPDAFLAAIRPVLADIGFRAT